MNELKSIKELVRYQEDLENISLQLEALYNMVDIISGALQQQRVEKEVISCIDSIGYSVIGIRSLVDARIQQLITCKELDIV